MMPPVEVTVPQIDHHVGRTQMLNQQERRTIRALGRPGLFEDVAADVVSQQPEGAGNGVRVSARPGRGGRVDVVFEEGAGGVGDQIVAQLQRKPQVGAERRGILHGELTTQRLDMFGLLARIHEDRIAIGGQGVAQLVAAAGRDENGHAQLIRCDQTALIRPLHRVTQSRALVGRRRREDEHGLAGAPDVFDRPRDDEQGGQCLGRAGPGVTREVEHAQAFGQLPPGRLGATVEPADLVIELGQQESWREIGGILDRCRVVHASGDDAGQAVVVVENEVSHRWARHRWRPP
jgi:hypothetical protein